MHRPVSRAAALLICWVAFAAAPASADVLAPEDFASLGTLAWSSGGYTIDTDALTIDGTANGNVQARGRRRASTGGRITGSGSLTLAAHHHALG